MIEILKISIPAIIVLIAAYYVLDKMLQNEDKRRRFELLRESSKTITPVKLAAYERFALFLERMSPESLLIRVQKPGMNVADLHVALLYTIREEFEHNVAQQIYISSDLWLLIKNAKESLVQFINVYSAKVSDDLPAIELSKVLLETYNSMEDSPIEIALSMLKKEFKSL